MSKTSLVGFFIRNSSTCPEAPATRFGEREFTHAQLLAAISNSARFLAKNGVGPGSKVAIYSDDDFDLCRAYGAIWHLGATAVPLNISYPDATLAAMENSLEPTIGSYSGTRLPSQETDRWIERRQQRRDGYAGR